MDDERDVCERPGCGAYERYRGYCGMECKIADEWAQDVLYHYILHDKKTPPILAEVAMMEFMAELRKEWA